MQEPYPCLPGGLQAAAAGSECTFRLIHFPDNRPAWDSDMQVLSYTAEELYLKPPAQYPLHFSGLQNRKAD